MSRVVQRQVKCVWRENSFSRQRGPAARNRCLQIRNKRNVTWFPRRVMGPYLFSSTGLQLWWTAEQVRFGLGQFGIEAKGRLGFVEADLVRTEIRFRVVCPRVKPAGAHPSFDPHPLACHIVLLLLTFA